MSLYSDTIAAAEQWLPLQDTDTDLAVEGGGALEAGVQRIWQAVRTPEGKP